MNFRLFFENETPEREAALNMIKDLKMLPNGPSWEGYPTWDFGNEVYISLTNQDRDLNSDILNNDNKNPNIWYIENIYSKNKGFGNANNAMLKLISMAKKNNVVLRLYPKRTERSKQSMNDKQLKLWYEKFGFKKISDLYYELR